VSSAALRRHPPCLDGGDHDDIYRFVARAWPGVAVLPVASFSRRLFRSRLPGRRLFYRHPGGVSAFDGDFHHRSAAANIARVPRLARARPHRGGDQSHHRLGLELLFRRFEPARTVGRQHPTQRHGTADRRIAGRFRRAACQNRGDRLGRILRSRRHGDVAVGTLVGRAVWQLGLAVWPGGVRPARTGAAFGERLVDHHQPALLQAPARPRGRRGRRHRGALHRTDRTRGQRGVAQGRIARPRDARRSRGTVGAGDHPDRVAALCASARDRAHCAADGTCAAVAGAGVCVCLAAIRWPVEPFDADAGLHPGLLRRRDRYQCGARAAPGPSRRARAGRHATGGLTLVRRLWRGLRKGP
jgi:hypothetical protein